MKNFEFPHRSR